jgi:hypothetical protein
MDLLGCEWRINVRRWFFVSLYFAFGTGVLPAETVPQIPLDRTLRPSDTGRSVTFRIGSSNVFDGLAVKTNLLYWVFRTPNLGIEIGLSPKISFELAGGYSPWKKGEPVFEDGSENTGYKQFAHTLIKPEIRYWPGGRFSGHFVGLQGFYADYQVARTSIPVFFEKDCFYDGDGFGVGAVYGYHWQWQERWRVEFSLGLGVIRTDYVQKDCHFCDLEAIRYKKTYLTPTGAGVKLVFMIK